MSETKIVFRDEVRQSDITTVRKITESTGFFYPEEVDTAVELVEERLSKGIKSGYYFIFAEIDGRTVGYTCYGPIACTKSSFDHYWMVVEADLRGKGIGSKLLKATEEGIKALGGTRTYIETSSRPLYDPTRGLYLHRGYSQVALLEDFYGPGDSKVVYLKLL